MNIHEYQAKGLLAGYGVAVARGKALLEPGGAADAVAELGGPVWVVKAQIHAGGRGKAGGVKLCKSAEEAVQCAHDMFGKVLVTHQTGPAGKEVRRVYIEDGCDIATELYVGAVIDRSSARVAFMASSEGGVEIEQVAAESPEKIITATIDPAVGCQAFHARKLAFGLGLEGVAGQAAAVLDQLLAALRVTAGVLHPFAQEARPRYAVRLRIQSGHAVHVPRRERPDPVGLRLGPRAFQPQRRAAA
ncbi:MAG: hypothetical protein QF767_12885, partial [Alphaproteobacteria bacterium]|nr:hypothetical protein [Alphaproteobacteria bacterium]